MPFVLAQATDVPVGIGLEWMPVASIIVPIVLLLAIVWYGSRSTV
ncbi:MAG: hypothetical protein AAGI91_01100 [Bacteroidota bacterium]